MHALLVSVFMPERKPRRGGGDTQRSQGKHQAKSHSFPKCEIQTLELTGGKKHDDEIFEDRECSSRDRKGMYIQTFTMNGKVPERPDGQALEPDADSKGDGVAGNKSHDYFDDEAESWGRKDAEVEEEDGEFGNVSDKCVEDLGNVIELRM